MVCGFSRFGGRLTRVVGVLALAVACAAGAKVAPAMDEDDAAGELIGDLMFHADLMATLDTLCPVSGARRDWRAVVRTLPANSRTPDLLDLSRRLSADAARSIVHGSGGCGTRHYTQVYAQTRNEYESLLEQWARLST